MFATVNTPDPLNIAFTWVAPEPVDPHVPATCATLFILRYPIDDGFCKYKLLFTFNSPLPAINWIPVATVVVTLPLIAIELISVREFPEILALAPMNVCVPIPVSKDPLLLVKFPPKTTLGSACSSQVPPLVKSTSPVKVFSPVSELISSVIVDSAPSIVVLPVTVKIYAPIEILPLLLLWTYKLPEITSFAPTVTKAAPEIFKFPPIVATTIVVVTEPPMFKSLPIVVTPVIITVPLPLKPKVSYAIGFTVCAAPV